MVDQIVAADAGMAHRQEMTVPAADNGGQIAGVLDLVGISGGIPFDFVCTIGVAVVVGMMATPVGSEVDLAVWRVSAKQAATGDSVLRSPSPSLAAMRLPLRSPAGR